MNSISQLADSHCKSNSTFTSSRHSARTGRRIHRMDAASVVNKLYDLHFAKTVCVHHDTVMYVCLTGRDSGTCVQRQPR